MKKTPLSLTALLLASLSMLVLGSSSSQAQVVTGTQDFSITVESVADVTPDAFAFAAGSSVQLSTVTTSASATISGINAATNISVSGQGAPEYSIDNGVTWTSVAGTVTNGAAVKVRLTSAATASTIYTATLTIGGVSANYVVTTRVTDQTPDVSTGFTTQNLANAQLSTVYTSNPVTISGMDPGVPTNLFVYGVTTAARNTGSIQVRVNGGAWVGHNVLTSVQNGDTVEVKMTSSASTSTSHATGIYVNSVLWTTWSVATRAPDAVPDAFTINNVTRAMRLTDYIIPVTLTGFEATTVRGKTNASVSKDGSNFTSSVSIVTGETVYVKVTTSANINTGVTATITTDYGGAGAADKSFSLTTKPNEADAYSTALGTAGTVDTKAVKNFYSRVVYIGSTAVLRSVAVTECANLGAGWYLPNYTAHAASLNTNRSTLFGTTSKAIWNDASGTVTQLGTVLVNNAATGSTTAGVVCLKTDPTVTLP